MASQPMTTVGGSREQRDASQGITGGIITETGGESAFSKSQICKEGKFLKKERAAGVMRSWREVSGCKDHTGPVDWVWPGGCNSKRMSGVEGRLRNQVASRLGARARETQYR